jgi:hypothetical protein
MQQLKNVEVFRAVWEANGQDAYYDQNFNKNQPCAAIRLAAAFRKIFDTTQFRFVGTFGEAQPDSHSQQQKINSYDSVSFAKPGGQGFTNFTRIGPLETRTLNDGNSTWALGGGGVEPNLAHGMDSSVKETCFHVQSVCKTICAMARLPGSHTPVTTASTKPVQSGAGAAPAKPPWVQNNDLRYVDSRLSKNQSTGKPNFDNLKHADILHIHNFFKWFNNFADDQVKRIVFSSESDRDKKGFWNATFPGSTTVNSGNTALTYEDYPAGTFPNYFTPNGSPGDAKSAATDGVDWKQLYPPVSTGQYHVSLADPLPLNDKELKLVLETAWAITGSATAADLFDLENAGSPSITSSHLATFAQTDFEIHESDPPMNALEAVNSIEKFREKFEDNFRAVETIARDGRLPELVRSLGIPSFDEANITIKYPRYPTTIGHFKSFLAFLINEEITEALTTGLITAASLKKHFRFRPGCSTTE